MSESAYRFLKGTLFYNIENPSNVVVVHCQAGKGRTGTMISCILIYCGFLDKASEALGFYSFKRFKSKSGVTQPSQRRYVKYLECLYKGRVISPQPKELKKLIIYTKPNISKFNPYFNIYYADEKKLVC